MSKIIVLNGTSSSGKSSLARELQEILVSNIQIVSIDSYIEKIPENLFEEKIDSVVTEMVRVVKKIADTDNNVILDTVFYAPKRRCEELKVELKNHQVYFVKVICSNPLELNRREIARGDRPIGVAESEMSIVYNNYQIDLEVDTSKESVKNCVQKIIKCSNFQVPPNRLS